MTTCSEPHAPDAENAILARLVENPDKFWPRAAIDGIEAGFFHGAQSTTLWQILADRRALSQPMDFVSIREAVANSRSSILDLPGLSKIMMASDDADTWDDHVAILRDRYARRVAIATAGDAGDGQSALALLRTASERVASILSAQRHVLDAKQAVDAFLAEFQERNLAGEFPGLATGIDAIDQHSGGMRKGEFWVIGGRSSSGKSAMMLQMTHAAIQTGKRVVYFSMEMSTQEIIGRLASSIGTIGMEGIMKPAKMKKWEVEKMKPVLTKIRSSGFHTCDKGGMTIDEITAHSLRLADSGPVDLVVIDYLQLIEGDRTRGQNRQEEVAKISRQCKQLAKRIRCPVLTGSQLNDDGKTRESRAIVQDADVLLQIEEESIGVAKMRNGKRDVDFPMSFDGMYQTFNIQKPRGENS